MKQPSQILEELCEKNNLKSKIKYEPHNKRVIINKMEFYGPTEVDDEGGQSRPSKEPLALEALKNWHKLPHVGNLLFF